MADWDRPAVWVLDPDGVTRHPGREHGRRIDRRRGPVVLVAWTGARGLRYMREVHPDRVTPRELDTPKG